ncbi:E3 ubiquitin-protein ligase UPL4 isoform X2 [Nicotiana tomentosiformis]|uniref:E3 ubiquitin-protein ligase UPL4 isoform X2 n=1 Tax=Nicotiana tomentosiformis TaxID=4098 RepID=UPI00051BF9D6|nr:E3 ubiquitin-protein ligase UPL4 isoform X2 [Nicotiana tomentosiformis]XP_016461947.1 PREDICTED: E3 ubiquitin-protein ligase UPL4-like isoform X2 [Nicotiana tabacum]
MGNRGQKRTETVDELPADKRACSSTEFRPSTSNSVVHTTMSSIHESNNGDVDTSSSSSGSSEGGKDSAYGSCESDNSFRDYYRRQSLDNQGKFKGILSSLSKELSDESALLAALTELCELLSFSPDSSISNLMADSFSPILVRLARHESNPDIMLLAIRAMTYLCEGHPRSSAYLVRHDAVPALCQRLMAIEYLDVAEQCLQALEKISHDQPIVCLQSGAIMAILSYIDFFSTSVQRKALSTVVNICKKLPSECPSPLMDAVPILCNLLLYEDRQLVESVATCLIRIVEQVCRSSDMLDELCKHGLVQQATHLIQLNGRTTVCQSVYVGLIGLLVKLAAGSIVAVRTLFELNISRISKDILSTCDFSHGGPSTLTVDGHYNQVDEVLKLLNELLPPISREQNIQLAADKEHFLINHPDLLQKFGFDLFPVLIQVVSSGVNLYACYSCLSVINKLVYFSKSDMLEFLQNTNISSFLAGVFTRNDPHVLILALQIVDKLLEKLSHVFLNSFVKEGVLFAVDALLSPEKCSQFLFSDETCQGSVPCAAVKCLCFASESPTGPEAKTCKIEKETLQNLARHIRTNYFATDSMNPDLGITNVLQKLKTLSSALTDLVHKASSSIAPLQEKEDLYPVLHQIMSELNGNDAISTFEFIESGVVKSLVNYLSNGRYLGQKVDGDGSVDQLYIVEKRFELFGRLLLYNSVPPLEDSTFLALIKRLHSALSSVENFPVILSHASKLRNSYATVPYGRCTSYPCLKVQFVKGDGESSLGDYTECVVNVDPFSPLETIEGYLWPKVSRRKSEKLKPPTLATEDESSSRSSQDVSTSQGKSPGPMELDTTSTNAHETQEVKSNLQLSVEAESMDIEKTKSDSMDISNINASLEKGKLCSSEDDSSTSLGCTGCSDDEDVAPKLIFYLEGQQLNQKLTLYQTVLHQQIKAGNDIITNSSMWSQVHRVTYRRCVRHKPGCAQSCKHVVDSTPSGKPIMWWQYTPFFSSMFSCEMVDLEKSSPTYEILFLLKSLEGMNRFSFHLMSHIKIYAFAEGKTTDFSDIKVTNSDLPQNEFANSKLTEKLELQMRNPFSVSIGGMPPWCGQLVNSCPFLFGFEARCKYFRLAAFGQPPIHPEPSSHNTAGGMSGRHQNNGGLRRKKILVHRNRILDSATQMMDLHADQKVVIEVEYSDEVGTGLGPTLEFFTLVGHEFQKIGLGMWRGDSMASGTMSVEQESGMLFSSFGLFPRPWSPLSRSLSGLEFSEVLKKFGLLGQIVAKALQDGRVLDLPLSKAFYKLVLGRELTVYDIQSFEPELGRALLEFQALVERKRHLESLSEGKPSLDLELNFGNTKIDDLYLDYTLPGYPDYVFNSASDAKMVDMSNLEEYVSLIVDASLNSGISRQIGAFKSGFDQVFPIKHLQVFTEDELERLLCGECGFWNSNELLDHIKFDHGYTASSPPVVNLLEIMREFDSKQQRAFLQFVTGAPRLPPGGLASLSPKLTIVRKTCSGWVDADLPSVMTCANYLKLPPYSSKGKMKEKLLYAITEGQGSFYLS